MAVLKDRRKTFPLWFQDGAINVNYISESIRCANNLNDVVDVLDIDTIATTSTGSSKWWGAAAATNGFIYCAPLNANTILKIDVETGAVSEIGSFSGANKYAQAILAKNGKIYFVPCSAAEVLVVEPENADNTYTFGLGQFPAGSFGHLGGALDKTGRYIYAAPFLSSVFIKIDTELDSVSTFGNFLGSNKWAGGSPGANGDLYFAPSNEDPAIKVDTDTDTPTTFGSFTTAANKFYGTGTDKNGDILFLTVSTQDYKKIEVQNSDNVVNIPRLGMQASNGALGPDGNFYMGSYAGSVVHYIDSDSDTVTTLGAGTVGSMRGMTLGENGQMFTTPGSADYVVRVGGEISVDKDLVLSRIFNR